MKRVEGAALVVLTGVCAALHVGKLPTALPVLTAELGLTLVEAGFLLSLVQLAGLALGIVAGLAADGFGLKRSMTTGLVLLGAASFWGGFAHDAKTLLALRALEGLGFLLATMPAPSLIRQLVPPSRVQSALGFWGAYMPFGTASALAAGPHAVAWLGWRGWWWLLAAVSLGMAAWLFVALPQDDRPSAGGGWRTGWLPRLKRTLAAPGPWRVAVTFAMYSGQWLAVVGFLPLMYAQAGWSGANAGMATAVAAAANILGNVGAGRLLQRGARPAVLLATGFAVMGVTGATAFGSYAYMTATPAMAVLSYGCVLAFSAVGGLIPGTLFSVAVRVAPDPQTVSTTVGWVQQWSAAGQLSGPPLVAWVAHAAGGWQWAGWVTGAFAATGLALAATFRSRA